MKKFGKETDKELEKKGDEQPKEVAKPKETAKAPRKGVKHNLSSFLSATSTAIDKYMESYICSKHRGENLTVEEWQEIIKKLEKET